ncbi:hypothetical protein B0H16DRAFT_1573773 [Mycena metata]|uniref:Uncharacterized protein n=1 Tax=Mycena metata TaxID=1033252 RepID=A0AAD7I7C3_9AGAR|nr:hypothetical protein B0H16DRAFT_1573773 [Mycena metata]
MWSFDDYKFEQPQRTQTFLDDAKKAAATIKRLEEENNLLRKGLEAVRLALDIDGSEDATDSDLSAVIEKEISNLREAIEAGEAQRREARKDERAAKRGLRAQHAEPSPIVYGGIGGPAFIARYESDITHSPVTVDGIMHNTVFLYSGHKRWGFQVLVGNDSRLRWIPIVGRFDIGLIGYHPVPGWDKKGGNVSDTLFIARCWNNQYNTWGLTTLKDGASGIQSLTPIRPFSVEGQRCEVLCYENWR